MTPQCTQSLLYLLTHLTSWRDSTVYSKILTIDVLYCFLKQMKSMHMRATTGEYDVTQSLFILIYLVSSGQQGS